MDFYNNLKSICKQKGISLSKVLTNCGLSKSHGTYWKNGGLPKSDVVTKIADYLNVSVDSLFGRSIDLYSNIETLPTDKVFMIPVFENVSAGFGAYACSDIVEYFPLYINNPSDAKHTLCIKVTGDSMYPKIEDGDMIVVRKQESVDSGQMAVVMIDNEEGVVKKVNYGVDWIELISINPMYPPLRFEGEDVLRISVVGIVKQIIKNA